MVRFKFYGAKPCVQFHSPTTTSGQMCYAIAYFPMVIPDEAYKDGGSYNFSLFLFGSFNTYFATDNTGIVSLLLKL